MDQETRKEISRLWLALAFAFLMILVSSLLPGCVRIVMPGGSETPSKVENQ